MQHRVSPHPYYMYVSSHNYVENMNSHTVRFLTKSAIPKQEVERRALLRNLNIPSMVATEICNKCNGYFGSKGIYDEAGQIQSYSMFTVRQ